MAMKTPGVYIVEKNAFPNSVVQVATAVPAFIGYTQMAVNGNVSLHEEPMRITSISEYHQYFGGAPEPVFRISAFEERAGTSPLSPDGADMPAELPQAVFTAEGPTGAQKFELTQVNRAFNLYGAMRLFFQNGGGACYVTSIGTYEKDEIDANAMLRAITRLKKEPEPTMVVIPETTRLTRQNAVKVQQAMLKHCGADMRNRFAILDISGGYLTQRSSRGDPVGTFRSDVGINNLDFAAAYYPWLNSSVFQSRDFTFENIEFDSRKKLISLLKRSVRNNPDIVPEIERVGTPMLTGDFTISVKSGAETKVTVTDISAKDETSSAAGLTYRIEGEEKTMAGRLKVKGGDAPDWSKPVVMTFTQQDLEGGKVSFEHNAELGDQGSFDLTVIDETGIETSVHRIAVIAGSDVMKLPDVERGKKVTIKVADGVEGADPASVRLLNADPIDEGEAVEADAAAKAAKEAAEAEDATDELKKAAEDAKADVLAALVGKTRTVPKVGKWSVSDKGEITFAPVADFRASVAEASYVITAGDKELPPAKITVLLDGVPPAQEDDPDVITIDKTMRAIAPLYNEVMRGGREISDQLLSCSD